MMNFTGEAAKVLAVLAGFEAEIKRLSTENIELTKENKDLKLQLSNQHVRAATEYSNSWEVPPQEVEEHSAAQEERVDEVQEPQSKQHKRRGPNRPAQQETRCNALLPSLELSSEGNMIPSQCKRSAEHFGFCKQHADHQNYGTTQQPNVELFEKNHNALEKAFQKKIGIVVPSKKARKPKSAAKRALNPYMMFLQVNRDKVKEELVLENPQLKGKELAMAITRHVGRLWQSAKANFSSEEEDVSDDSTEYSETEVEAELDQLLGC
jgi:hypothetical protein